MISYICTLDAQAYVKIAEIDVFTKTFCVRFFSCSKEQVIFVTCISKKTYWLKTSFIAFVWLILHVGAMMSYEVYALIRHQLSAACGFIVLKFNKISQYVDFVPSVGRVLT